MAPLVLAAALALSIATVFLGVELAFGELRQVLRGEAPPWKVEEYRFALVFALLIGYLPAAYHHAVRGSRRTWEALRPVLRCSPAEFAAQLASAGRFDPARLRRSGLIGAALAMAVPFVVDLDLSAYRFDPDHFETAPALHRVMLPVIGWFFGRLVHAVLSDSTRLARAGREQVQVDLLDLGPLSPFTRQGLHTALLAMGAVAILALLLVDWGARPGIPAVLSVGLLLAAGMAAAGLWLPVRGVHAAIRRAKRAEIEACNAAIRRRREALASEAAGTTAGPRLDELVAWRGLVAAVREWPFDASTFSRFALYLALPVGSWLGGALVERLVDAALG